MSSRDDFHPQKHKRTNVTKKKMVTIDVDTDIRIVQANKNWDWLVHIVSIDCRRASDVMYVSPLWGRVGEMKCPQLQLSRALDDKSDKLGRGNQLKSILSCPGLIQCANIIFCILFESFVNEDVCTFTIKCELFQRGIGTEFLSLIGSGTIWYKYCPHTTNHVLLMFIYNRSQTRLGFVTNNPQNMAYDKLANPKACSLARQNTSCLPARVSSHCVKSSANRNPDGHHLLPLGCMCLCVSAYP